MRRKRSYSSFGQFFSDLRNLLRDPAALRVLVHDQQIPTAFRERLMIAVSRVNGCRYCSFYHAKIALLSGVERQEIRHMLGGEFADCPEHELPAILYAQHWAEKDGQPDAEARQKVTETYGPVMARKIETVLRAIRIGNLLGNAFDEHIAQRNTHGYHAGA